MRNGKTLFEQKVDQKKLEFLFVCIIILQFVLNHFWITAWRRIIFRKDASVLILYTIFWFFNELSNPRDLSENTVKVWVLSLISWWKENYHSKMFFKQMMEKTLSFPNNFHSQANQFCSFMLVRKFRSCWLANLTILRMCNFSFFFI